MKSSIVGFKTASADLHRRSPWIFLACLCASMVTTVFLIRMEIPHERHLADIVEVKPVILHIENIPETRQRPRAPAPPKPFVPASLPVEVEDELLPDEITIEETTLELEAAPDMPPSLAIPDVGAAAEEEEIFEYFAVDEPPVRLNTVVPEYPPMAERAGITGRVTLKVLVNAEGRVDSVAVIDGPRIFHATSIEAAKKTKFSPARHNDKPVPCWIIMPFRFVREND